MKYQEILKWKCSYQLHHGWLQQESDPKSTHKQTVLKLPQNYIFEIPVLSHIGWTEWECKKDDLDSIQISKYKLNKLKNKFLSKN